MASTVDTSTHGIGVGTPIAARTAIRIVAAKVHATTAAGPWASASDTCTGPVHARASDPRCAVAVEATRSASMRICLGVHAAAVAQLRSCASTLKLTHPPGADITAFASATTNSAVRSVGGKIHTPMSAAHGVFSETADAIPVRTCASNTCDAIAVKAVWSASVSVGLGIHTATVAQVRGGTSTLKLAPSSGTDLASGARATANTTI